MVLSGPPCEQEAPIADQVEAVMKAEGLHPGPRECHDAQPGREQVDFIYPEARPMPIALEVTSIPDDDYLAGVRASIQRQEKLSRIAEQEQLGSWLVTVVAVKNLKAIEDDILKLIRRGYPIRPGQYTHRDLMGFDTDRGRRDFIDMHRRLKDKGLVEVERWPSRRQNVVGLLLLTGARTIGGFSHPLKVAIDDNAEKLGNVRDHEHHLAVLVGRFDASTHPELTPVPALPIEIEVLWIVTRYWSDGAPTGVWPLGAGYRPGPCTLPKLSGGHQDAQR
jgi:hypothetical protein